MDERYLILPSFLTRFVNSLSGRNHFVKETEPMDRKLIDFWII